MFKRIHKKIDTLRRDWSVQNKKFRMDIKDLKEGTNFHKSKVVKTLGIGRAYSYKEIPVKDVVEMILDYLELDLDEIDIEKTVKGYGLKRKEGK